jgi:hypothetical protein
MNMEIGVRYSAACPTGHPVSYGLGVLRDMELNQPLFYFTVPGTVMALVGIELGSNMFQRRNSLLTPAIA